MPHPTRRRDPIADTRHQRQLLVSSWGEWAEQLVTMGYSLDLLTFLFDPLPGPPAGQLRTMLGGVERLYATFVTHVVRRPLAPSSRGRLPIWFCCPDLPVFKHQRASKSEVLVNDGLHLHAAAFTPPRSRLRGSLEEHFVRHEPVYLRAPVQRLDVQPVTHNAGNVVDYLFKSIKRGRVDGDALLVLPRTVREMRG